MAGPPLRGRPPDVVFSESLYQLIDYIPKGGGRARRHSMRFGAIGLSFRSGKNTFYNVNANKLTKERLISEWGMTDNEAEHARKDGFALCLVIRTPKNAVMGVLFIRSGKISSIVGMDISDTDTHDRLDHFLKKIENDSNCKQRLYDLAEALEKVHSKVAPSGTYISVYN